MPSVFHEGFLTVLQHEPRVLIELLTRAGLGTLPLYDKVVTDAADLGVALPPELHADSVLRLERSGETAAVVVVEVQLRVDQRKAFTWPAYVAGARQRYGCDALLVVVTADRTTAAWARKPIVLGPATGFVQALVLGPEELPAVTKRGEALASPWLAVASAVAHARDRDRKRSFAVARRALAASRSRLGDDRTMVYDLIMASFSEAARKAFRMQASDYIFKDPDLRKAQLKGEAKGEARGEVRGEARGEAKGKSQAILRFLAARRIRVSATQRARIEACQDIEKLDRWLEIAATSETADALFR